MFLMCYKMKNYVQKSVEMGLNEVQNRSIDVVLYWVDERDTKWQEIKERYFAVEKPDRRSDSRIRYQGWDNLKYLFRGIEAFMPWIHRVYFVTCGQKPEFLNENSEKLVLVNHDEFMPSKYLPTFNSSAIEMNFHRINGLSENFIIFNDDMFPIRPVSEEYYFIDNLPCDEAVENIITTAAFGPVGEMARYSTINNMFIINRHFRKRQVQEQFPYKWFNTKYEELLERTESLKYWNDFPGFYDPHVPSGLKKSVMQEIWNAEEEALDKSCQSRFRSYRDVTQYVVRYWQLCSGEFVPRKTVGRPFFVDGKNYMNAVNAIKEQSMPVVCINENCEGAEFETIKAEVNSALDLVLPNKSSFEK